MDITNEEKIKAIMEIPASSPIKLMLVSEDAIDQMIKAHQLKYIENTLEVEEENNLVEVNVKDFLDYPVETQTAAMDIYQRAIADPEFFERPDADKSLIKPVMILSNIENKKNESKIKSWKVEYHVRLISRLINFKHRRKSMGIIPTKHSIINWFKNISK